MPSTPFPTESDFETFFRAHYAVVVRYAVGFVGDGDTARDLAQEAFVKAWEARDRLSTEPPPIAWVFAVVRNAALNRTRRNRLVPMEAVPEPEPEEDRGRELPELQAALRSALRDLPERQREAFLLTRYQGMAHADAARVMGCAPRTVNNHLVAALATLRRALTPWLNPATDP